MVENTLKSAGSSKNSYKSKQFYQLIRCQVMPCLIDLTVSLRCAIVLSYALLS